MGIRVLKEFFLIVARSAATDNKVFEDIGVTTKRGTSMLQILYLYGKVRLDILEPKAFAHIYFIINLHLHHVQ